MKKPILLSVIMCMVFMQLKAQDTLRPFNDWESIAFCSFEEHHPFYYINLDNNWEIMYNLRTPMTRKQLNDKGIRFNESQLAILKLAGFIEEKDTALKTTMPIFDESQTTQIRNLSRQLAEKTFKNSEADYRNFVKVLESKGLKDNAFSLTFSYVLDFLNWGLITPKKQAISHQKLWDGIIFTQFAPRNTQTYGTNSSDGVSITWNSYLKSYPDQKLLTQFSKEVKANGRILDVNLAKALSAFGLVDEKGNVRIPVISMEDEESDINTAAIPILMKNAKGLSEGIGKMKEIGKLDNDNYAKVVLYHEMMWDIVDLLVKKQIISVPSILQKGSSDKAEYRKITYIIQ